MKKVKKVLVSVEEREQMVPLTVSENETDRWTCIYKQAQEIKAQEIKAVSSLSGMAKLAFIGKIVPVKKSRIKVIKEVNQFNHGLTTQSAMVDSLLLQGVYTLQGIAKELIEKGLSDRNEKVTVNRVRRHLDHVQTVHGMRLINTAGKLSMTLKEI